MLKPILAYYFRKKDANASTIQMLPTQQSLHDKDSAQKNADEANVITEGKSTGIGQYNASFNLFVSCVVSLITPPPPPFSSVPPPPSFPHLLFLFPLQNVEVRWISLAFFLIIAIQSIIVLVVLVAIQ